MERPGHRFLVQPFLIANVYSYFEQTIAKVVPFSIQNTRYFDAFKTSLSRDHVSKSLDLTFIVFNNPQTIISLNFIEFS